ncbi:hypothetical protein [Microvirga roseola]|uniref:hypothetical protein n=1 Tax=Microvirga roseola TaxID=2883126 RepID=UPI001E363380|nr:hypothetical protein [Microvirga roseola]
MAEKKPHDQNDFTGTVKPATSDSSGFGVATGPDASPGAGDNAAPTDDATGGDGKSTQTPGPTGSTGEQSP